MDEIYGVGTIMAGTGQRIPVFAVPPGETGLARYCFKNQVNRYQISIIFDLV